MKNKLDEIIDNFKDKVSFKDEESKTAFMKSINEDYTNKIRDEQLKNKEAEYNNSKVKLETEISNLTNLNNSTKTKIDELNKALKEKELENQTLSQKTAIFKANPNLSEEEVNAIYTLSKDKISRTEGLTFENAMNEIISKKWFANSKKTIIPTPAPKDAGNSEEDNKPQSLEEEREQKRNSYLRYSGLSKKR